MALADVSNTVSNRTHIRNNSTVRRDKKSCSFMVTFQIDEKYEQVREDYFLLIQHLCSEYLVAVESSKQSDVFNHHLHIYFKTLDKFKLSDLRKYFVEFVCGEPLDLQVCRSARNILKYFSKEDSELITNVNRTRLSFNYNCVKWASENNEFSYIHPFVVEHRNNYRFLEKYHAEAVLPPILELQISPFCENDLEWVRDVKEWWNFRVLGEGVRRDQLYLYGPTGIGKSYLIEKIISDLSCVFFPDVGQFYMHGFRKSFHKVILFEEFSYQSYNINSLKRLIEGRMYSYSQKCGAPIMFKFDGPVIFVSNDNPNLYIPSFLDRLKVVYADVRNVY